MNDDLKKAFIAWEERMAAHWDAALRNPDFLQAIWPSVEAALQARQLFAASQPPGGFQDWQTAWGQPPGGLPAEIARLQAAAAQLEQRLDSLLADLNDG
jgi:hypothetical protein